jgi:hypothetical protein
MNDFHYTVSFVAVFSLYCSGGLSSISFLFLCVGSKLVIQKLHNVGGLVLAVTHTHTHTQIHNYTITYHYNYSVLTKFAHYVTCCANVKDSIANRHRCPADHCLLLQSSGPSVNLSVIQICA